VRLRELLDVWVVFEGRVNTISPVVVDPSKVANFWQLDCPLQLERVLVKVFGAAVAWSGTLSSSFPHRGFCTASTSLSPFPLENTGLSIVPPMRKGNCNLPSTNAAPDSRAMVLVKKPSLVVISAKPR
jgi:hypothetical protein